MTSNTLSILYIFMRLYVIANPAAALFAGQALPSRPLFMLVRQ